MSSATDITDANLEQASLKLQRPGQSHSADADLEVPRGILHRPPQLTFEQFVSERDRCRQFPGSSKIMLMNLAHFCNTNRLWDRGTKELFAALLDFCQTCFHKVLTVILHRMAGSPADTEGRGKP
eukprot:TRINITY_DN10614_c0_g1_i3.p2 TRINITY_DN10614_c0_g1~~TRINITY_DN10614_c0_g1_i3.p2  ORF type:complete len:125 (+),score=11.64 TRINITY_DN10614_c0_g1_i3:113-487(+)